MQGVIQRVYVAACSLSGCNVSKSGQWLRLCSLQDFSVDRSTETQERRDRCSPEKSTSFGKKNWNVSGQIYYDTEKPAVSLLANVNRAEAGTAGSFVAVAVCYYDSCGGNISDDDSIGTPLDISDARICHLTQWKEQHPTASDSVVDIGFSPTGFSNTAPTIP